MTKKEKLVLGVVSGALAVSLIALILFVARYLDLKVANYKVKQSLSDTKSMLTVLKQEREEKDAKIKELNSVVKKFSAKVSSLQAKIDALKSEKEKLEQKIEDINSEQSDIDEFVKQKDKQIELFKSQVAKLKLKLNDVKEQLAQKQKEYELLVKTGGRVDLQKINVVKSDKGDSRDKKISDLIGDKLNSKVLVMNRRYNFAVIGVNAPVALQQGWRVLIQKNTGDTFTSVIDSVKQNMVTVDVPGDVELASGEQVIVILEGKI